jgi:hypothetical protein
MLTNLAERRQMVLDLKSIRTRLVDDITTMDSSPLENRTIFIDGRSGQQLAYTTINDIDRLLRWLEEYDQRSLRTLYA